MESYFPSVCRIIGLVVSMRFSASSPSHFLNLHSLVPFQHQSVGILSSITLRYFIDLCSMTLE